MCDSVINLMKLQKEKPIQQNHELLTENVFTFGVEESCRYPHTNKDVILDIEICRI